MEEINLIDLNEEYKQALKGKKFIEDSISLKSLKKKIKFGRKIR